MDFYADGDYDPYQYGYPHWMPRMMPVVRVAPPWECPPPPFHLWDAVKSRPVFDPVTCADPYTTLSRIEKSAQESFRTKDYLGALWKYRYAVNLCKQLDLLEELPFMRAECADVALLIQRGNGIDEVDGLMYAYREANWYIIEKSVYTEELDTSSNDIDFVKYESLLSKMYFTRAEASKRLILMEQADFIASTNPVVDAINDYCKSFAIDPKRVDALVEAIVLAVDHKVTGGLLMLSNERILDGSGAKVLSHVVQNVDGRLTPQHLEFFVFNMVPPTASLLGDTPINLSRLIKIGVAKTDILNRMIQIGVKFKMKDLKDLVQNFDEVDDFIKILDISMTHCSLTDVQLKSAADTALHAKKYKFVAHLIKKGAKPDVASVIKILDLSRDDGPVFLSYMLENGSPKKIVPFLIKTLNHIKETCNRSEQEHAEHGVKPSLSVSMLLNAIQCSKTLCGKDAISGMRDIVAQCLNDFATINVTIELVCLLLQCSLDLCQARYEKTTPLHAATMLALESGSTDIISAVKKCADFTLPGDGRVIDKNGDCPYHLVVKSNRDDSVKLKVCVALNQLDPPLDPTVSDAFGKGKKARQAKEYAGKSSEVFMCLVTAEVKFALVQSTSESAMNGILSELKKARSILECISIMENVKLFKEVVQILEKVGMREEALKQALKYENNGTKLADMGVECLAHKYAALYSTQKNTGMLETVLAYIPDHSAKARYWRRCGKYEKAIEIYIEKKMFEHAFRLMSCLGWYDRGLELARKENDKKWIVNFAVEGAKASLHDHQALDTGALECLEDLLRDREVSGHNKLVPIIHLLVGCGGGKAEHILKAVQMFAEQGNIIGELESCIRLLHLLKDAPKNKNCTSEVLRACYIAQHHAKALSQFVALDTATTVHIFHLALVLYGFQSKGLRYFLHPRQGAWTGDLKQYEAKGSNDIHGAVILDPTTTRLFVLDQLGRLSKEILDGNAAIKRKLQNDVCDEYNTLFYKQVNDCIILNCSVTLLADDLKQYISVHINWLEYCYIVQQSTDGAIRQLLTLFSPNVSPHLPPGLLHLKLVRSSTLACESIFKWLSRALGVMATSEESKADVWLMLWKASCIVGKGGEELRTLVKDLAHKVDDNDVVPVPYLFLDRYIHQFDFWLQSCDLICTHGEIVASAEFVIKYFLSHIAATAKRGGQIMVMNVVEILSIHSTALLGVIMRSQHRLSGKVPVFMVPRLYECVIETFDELNTYGRGGYRLLEACAHQADICPEVGLMELSSKALQLLRHSLDLLLGVLKFSLYDPKLLSSGFSCHSLILALTIVGNIATHSPDDSAQHHDIIELIRGPHMQRRSRYITEALRVLSASDWISSIFSLVQTMTNNSNPNVPGIAQLTWDNEIKFAPCSPAVCSLQQAAGRSLEPFTHLSEPIDKLTQIMLANHVQQPSQMSFVHSGTQDGCDRGDPLMVTMGYCCACKLHSECSQMEEHITTAAHQQKVQLLQEYNTMERECLQLQQKLHTALQHLQDDDHQCAKQIHDIEEELERNSSIFDDIRWRSSWEGGVKELKQMKERVGLLCH